MLTHKDRLLRFDSELIFKLCKHFGIRVVILNEQNTQNFEETLSQDVIELMTVFCARLYGSRSHKNKASAWLFVGFEIQFQAWPKRQYEPFPSGKETNDNAEKSNVWY